MGSCFSKNVKHVENVQRSAPKHKEIIAQAAAQQEVISPKIIEELRRVSSDSSDLLKELKEVEGRQAIRGFGDRLMQRELKDIAKKYGYEICITGNSVSLTKAERSHSL